MGKSLQRLKQVAKPDEPDDTLSASTITGSESSSVNFGAFLNAILSQIKRIIHGDLTGNWHDDPVAVFGQDVSLFQLIPGQRVIEDGETRVIRSGYDHVVSEMEIQDGGILEIQDGGRLVLVY